MATGVMRADCQGLCMTCLLSNGTHKKMLLDRSVSCAAQQIRLPGDVPAQISCAMPVDCDTNVRRSGQLQGYRPSALDRSTACSGTARSAADAIMIRGLCRFTSKAASAEMLINTEYQHRAALGQASLAMMHSLGRGNPPLQ